MKKKIQEVIVVEGIHDASRLKQFFDCDVIVTSGHGLTQETLELIRVAQKKKGVIIFTDPDTPGDQIRQTIHQQVDGCKDAFVLKKDARTSKKVGVEHASYEVLEKALAHVVSFQENKNSLSMDQYIDLGLLGGSEAKEKRERISKAFHIGKANGKTLFARINALGITYDQIKEVIDNE